ncbi:uncharacterized protein CANTADRAFT_259743 [Suhomyces tanzawaensis NRRL Y-17324]|uniref:Uncharacterized protein n=1 Tax=Suhomyces tanzawaensis NRRL Y-17324 TaxID=984487 RepID=A0A1E4SJ52_9ASCO|nr:uncharacterized protein CANTADRAFT_259743 [Suhomyces tanzawaensis NRRL Y-17324]ODV79467.1 hypothetical protein CANTADRAFT_259743 [Suhomyces tanzawaensis NRRL Y-17324]
MIFNTSANGLVVKSNVAIVGPPVRFRVCAFLFASARADLASLSGMIDMPELSYWRRTLEVSPASSSLCIPQLPKKRNSISAPQRLDTTTSRPATHLLPQTSICSLPVSHPPGTSSTRTTILCFPVTFWVFSHHVITPTQTLLVTRKQDNLPPSPQ